MITADQGSLVFEPLGDTAWRLCDTSVEVHDAARLVAYVERVSSNGGYEAVWLGLGIPPSMHPSREDVLRTAQLVRDTRSASTRSKPVPIPHRAPVISGWG
ncbi:hypothetical protein J2Y46_004158 [Microbacterium sp. BE35]|uniref:hypothetical protein n=1 Tax=Microbacterium sp. BE35 TaxID=2817773 RepID=UPI00285FD6B1|nr:hypothetical protein [Microbacterium sp. BE35]MDR7191292.1 hypothetical protein [Microbacterium sp. BE35]